jgi:hypothetical protein
MRKAISLAANELGFAVLCDDGLVFVSDRNGNWGRMKPVPGTQSEKEAEATSTEPMDAPPPDGLSETQRIADARY